MADDAPDQRPIGLATMRSDGSIVFDLRFEGPGGMIAEAQKTYGPDEPFHQELLAHLGGLEPFESKMVPPWPDPDDPIEATSTTSPTLPLPLSDELLAELRQYRAQLRLDTEASATRRASRRHRIWLWLSALPRSRRAKVFGQRLGEELAPMLEARQLEVEAQHDAFPLAKLGLATTAYLTADGRVLYDEAAEGGQLREARPEDEIVVAIVAGAEATGLAGLLELLPAAPARAEVCTRCSGVRWMSLGPAGRTICGRCGGRGWQQPDQQAHREQPR